MCVSHVRVLFLWSAVKEKLTADPDSEIATTSLRVSLLCPVNTLPSLHELRQCLDIQSSQNMSVHSFHFSFSLYVTQHVFMHVTPGCVHYPPVKLSPPPLSCIVFMSVWYFNHIYIHTLCYVLTTCVYTLRSWGRCGWWSRVGRWHAPTCSALTPHSTSRWMKRSPPGCVLSVTRRLPMSTSSSTGKTPIQQVTCVTC